MKDSSLLQQASNLTNGIYFKIPQINGLLHYLLWVFLPNENLRKMLVLIPKTQVDFRAACFCHRQLIDIGFVCSVCLSVFCSFTPICTTCDCNFEFDLNILKLGKKINLKKSSQLSSIEARHDLATNISSNTSILQDSNRQNDARNHLVNSSGNSQLPISRITNTNFFDNLNDSFEMLE